MKKLKIGIVGATGLVGKTLIQIFKEEQMLSKIDLFLICSEKSSGKRMIVNGNEMRLITLNEKCLSLGLDVVVFSAGENVSLVWAEKFIKCGAVVIDNTNAFRREQSVPLVAPEINGKMLKNQKLISIPNCSTIQLAVVVHELQKLINVKKLIVSTYQSVSGAGKQALLDLQQHKTNVFKEGINKNIIPQIGVVGENGFCLEEDKIMFELNKILKTNIEVFAATVRVPIPNCHGESVYVEFDSEPNLTEIIKQLKNVPHIKFLENEVAVPTKCVGLNTTFVCRLRKTSKNSIMFFIVADNLRRGAAFNAFKIIEGLF